MTTHLSVHTPLVLHIVSKYSYNILTSDPPSTLCAVTRSVGQNIVYSRELSNISQEYLTPSSIFTVLSSVTNQAPYPPMNVCQENFVLQMYIFIPMIFEYNLKSLLKVYEIIRKFQCPFSILKIQVTSWCQRLLFEDHCHRNLHQCIEFYFFCSCTQNLIITVTF